MFPDSNSLCFVHPTAHPSAIGSTPNPASTQENHRSHLPNYSSISDHAKLLVRTCRARPSSSSSSSWRKILLGARALHKSAAALDEASSRSQLIKRRRYNATPRPNENQSRRRLHSAHVIVLPGVLSRSIPRSPRRDESTQFAGRSSAPLEFEGILWRRGPPAACFHSLYEALRQCEKGETLLFDGSSGLAVAAALVCRVPLGGPSKS